MRLESAAAGVILIVFAAGLLAAPRAEAVDPRGAELAEQASRAGLQYVCTALAWDPSWREDRSSGLIQLYSEGPYRMAFLGRTQKAAPGRWQVGVIGVVADYLQGASAREEIRGAGGESMRTFRPQRVRWSSTLTAEVEVGADPATGFPTATPGPVASPQSAIGPLDPRDFPELR